MESNPTTSTATTDDFIIDQPTGIEKMKDLVSHYGYPLLRLGAALAVVWFAGAASS